jgi:hypothetical protein
MQRAVPKVPPLSAEVERFILTQIPSVPYLEAALFFRSAQPIPRTLEDVAEALYLPLATASRLLQALCDGGVLSREGKTYRYAPKLALRRSMDLLAEAYQADLIGVTELIHGAARQDARRNQALNPKRDT